MTIEKQIPITHRARPVGVWARKIIDVAGNVGGTGHLLTLDDGGTHVIDNTMTARMFPLNGDYLIVSQDGYAYLNPSDVFESKYEPEPDAVTSRFKAGDAVMFQPRVDLIGTLREYEHSILAKVVRPRIIGGVLYYDIALRSEDHGGTEDWNPLDGVNNSMLLPMAEGGRENPDDIMHIRMVSLSTASAIARDSVGILTAAKEFETYLRSGTAIGTAPASRLQELVPSSGPQITSATLSHEVEVEYFLNGRQAVLAMGADDNPELDRLTVCILVLRSGALVMGSAIVSSAENVDANTGRKQAHEDAVKRLADYLGFGMKHGHTQ